MKFQVITGVVMVLAFTACKTPYKATDRTNSATDSTAISTDSTRASMDTTSNNMNRMADSSHIAQPDSSKMDSTMERRSSVPDSTNRPSTDSTRKQPVTDTSRSIPGIDSAASSSTTDSAASRRSSMDNPSANSQAPENIQSVFTTQYPGATNATWSTYDSLAAVPIDLRLTGWKRMDAEDHMVKFDLEGDTYYAWYDSDGKWIGSAYTMQDFTKLPPAVNNAVNNAIKKRYTDYNITQVNREFQKGKKAYEVELTKGNEKVRMLVGEDGKIGQIFKYSTETKNNNQ